MLLFYYAGVGTGLLYSPSIVVVGQYFEKKRGFANGLSLAGSGIGSIAVPPLMVYTLNTYGLEGTLLIMGGMALNICESGMLFRPPAFYMRRYVLKMEKRRRAEQPSGHRTNDKIVDVATRICASPTAVEDICEDAISIQSCPPGAQLFDIHSSQRNGNEYEASDNGNGTKEELETHMVVMGNISGEGWQPVKESKTTNRDDTMTEQLRYNARTEQPSGDRTKDKIVDVATGRYVSPTAVEDICEDAISVQSCPPGAQLFHRNSSQGNGNEYEASDNGKTKEEKVKESKTTDRDDTMTEQLRCHAITTNPQATNETQIQGVRDIDTHSINGASLTADLTGKSCPNEDQPCKKPQAFEYRLLINPIRLIYSASIATAGSVYFDMFIMATPHAEQLGFTHTKAALLVSIMGGADVISRVALGFFADFKNVNTQHLFHGSLAVSTVVLFILPSLKTYPAVASALVLFAVAGGGYFSLLPTLLAEALGIERLPTTFGIAMLIFGFADIVILTVMGKNTSIHSRNF